MPTIDQTQSAATSPSESAQGIVHLKSSLSKVAQTMYTQSLALNEKIRILSILQAIDKIIIESNRGLKLLSTDIAKAVTESSKFTLVSIFSQENLTDATLRFQGWSINKEFQNNTPIDVMLKSVRDLVIQADCAWMVSSRRYQVINLEEPQTLTTLGIPQEFALELCVALKNTARLRSLYLTKLVVSGRTIGTLLIGLEEAGPHIDDIELIERIGNTAGIALFNRMLMEDNLKNLEQLKESNAKLKAIDTTKDEFIAMASHQLRTPLTSMKGYLSMVLEGDYGPVTEEQKKALQQSFTSAQRMVYLVSDLLSISRLKTGKFVILNKPTDLTAIVEEEMSQLIDTAASKNIELTFNHPENVPKILLDTTKIRQVIMNFIDNAIYYTPAGGKVTVVLVYDGSNITFTVTDTGMGVPEKEQANLFGKFYRASNAKKSRPDGTGLGLYMAGKVIEAQGGSIVFHSKEGAGSIFGFNFPTKL